jgi:predicted dehydrogenase/nucleoside-diphosphate-sugar epimerase
MFESVDALFREAPPDIVHICTPPATHYELARKCLERGAHVYCEKPVVESVEEIDVLLALADERGLVLCPGHQLLFEPPARQLEILGPGLGRVVHLESYFAFRPVRRMPGGRAPQPADQQLLDILPHPVYLLLHVMERLSPDASVTVESIKVGADGTVHALLRSGEATGILVVTLTGRPVDSYVRVVGTNGSVHADFVRGITTQLIGPGTSGIDKALAPFQVAWQMATRTTGALTRRVLRRQQGYPGLTEIFQAMHAAVRGEQPLPISRATLRQTVAISAMVKRRLCDLGEAKVRTPLQTGPLTLAITGGTGLLGRATVETALRAGCGVRVLARRPPAPWERLPGVDYRTADLGEQLAPDLLAGADVVIHTAAETAGGWEDHERNSVLATRHVLEAMHAAGVRRLVHVSSTAVLQKARARLLDEQTPLEPNERGSGPYVWGKLASERLALQDGERLGVSVRVLRPSAIVDLAHFEPPGRLGKRLGGVFVAVGSPRERLPVIDLQFAAQALCWTACNFEASPPVLNLVASDLPTKRELIERLRRANPGISIVRLPNPVLGVLNVGALVLQKLLRPRRPAISLTRVFAVEQYNTRLIASLTPSITEGLSAGSADHSGR